MSLRKSSKQFLTLSLFLSGTTALGFISLYSSSLHETKASDISVTSTWDGSSKENCSHKVTMGSKSFYLIENANQLASLAGTYSISNNYLLINDIDLASHPWNAIAQNSYGHNGIQFTGILDGNGHTISNFRLPGTTSSHYDFSANSNCTPSNSGYALVGFIGKLGSGGVLKNMNFSGSSIEGAVGSTLRYWFNGNVVGLNNGTIRNMSVSSIKLRSEAWFYWGGSYFKYTYPQDTAMGILCGRNEAHMDYTVTKNCTLDVAATGDSKYYIPVIRYGHNVGYNNTSSDSSVYTYTNNYYYNNTLTYTKNSYTKTPDINNSSIQVSTADGFETSNFSGGDSLVSADLTDNFAPINSSGDVCQDDTSKALDYAARYLIGSCADCTSAFTQQCISLYNTNSAYKNVFDNLKSDQTYESTTTSMSATAKLEAFASRYGLAMNGASGSLVLEGTVSSRKNVALLALGGFALLLSGAYIYSRREKKPN